jgi:hypothetical protein
MTLFEWRYQQGWIWIAEREDGALAVICDPAGWDDAYRNMDEEGRKAFRDCGMMNVVSNTEIEEDSPMFRRIMYAWKSLGSPRINRKAPGYTAPEFPLNLDGCPGYVEDPASDSEMPTGDTEAAAGEGEHYTPNVDYCPGCGTFYVLTEPVCRSCGTPRK